MDFTYDENTYSDLHKDAYGFRPRRDEFYDPSTTPERKQEIWDHTLRALDDTIAWEKQAEDEAIVRFEKRVAEAMECGAGDRETALRWMEQAEDDEYADATSSYFKYCHGLPYSYDTVKGVDNRPAIV